MFKQLSGLHGISEYCPSGGMWRVIKDSGYQKSGFVALLFL